MIKKASGSAGKKGAVNKPVPSGVRTKNNKVQTERNEPKTDTAEKKIQRRNTGRKNTSENDVREKKKRPLKSRARKNTDDAGKKRVPDNKKPEESELLVLNKNDYGDNFSNPDIMDMNAEEILRKPHQRESALHFMKPLPAAKAPISPYKRKLKRLLFYAFMVIFLMSVCIVLSLTVFFKIDKITVEGETRYDTDDIIDACMIEQGDNLILCRTSPGESNIWKKFPYIESVSIRKKMFNAIVITVEEATPSTVIESDGKYILLSESGKIIDISNKQQEGLPMILGAKLETPSLSSSVEYTNENMEGYLNEILCCAERYNLGTLKIIDISNLSQIVLEHKKGLRIIIGTPDNIEHKIKTAGKVIEKGVSLDDTGTLDVSLSAEDGGKSYFNSKKPIVPQPSKPEASKPSKTSEPSGESSEQQSGEEASLPEGSDSSASEDSSDGSSSESGEYTDEDSEDDTGDENGDDTGDDNGDENLDDDDDNDDNGDENWGDNDDNGDENWDDDDNGDENWDDDDNGDENWDDNGDNTGGDND